MVHHLNSAGSSNVKEGRWDSDRRVLTLAFHSGGRYEYPGFSEEDWRRLQAAPSKGGHVAAHRSKWATPKRLV